MTKCKRNQSNAFIKELQLSSIPDVRLFNNGKEIDRFVGNLGEQPVREFFDNAAALAKKE